MLEIQMKEESENVLADGEKHLFDCIPEAIVQRQIGILKETNKKREREKV